MTSTSIQTVLVSGSRPGAIWSPADAIYTANASHLLNPAAYPNYAERTVVASGFVLLQGMRARGPNAMLDRTKFEAVRDVDADRIVLTGQPDRVRFKRIRDALKRARPELDIVVMSPGDQRCLFKGIIGSYPLIDRTALQQPLPVILRDAKQFVAAWLDGIFREGHRGVSNKYWPSSGIKALLFAIGSHGPSARYVVAGVGLADRGTYRFSEDGEIIRHQKRTDRSRELPLHVVADRIVLERLVRIYNVTTTEPELSSILPMYSETTS